MTRTHRLVFALWLVSTVLGTVSYFYHEDETLRLVAPPKREAVERPKCAVERCISRGILTHVFVKRDYIHCVRWYGDEPDWCLIHVGEEVYCIDHPGQTIWNAVFKDRPANLVLKVRNNNVDPYAPAMRGRQ